MPFCNFCSHRISYPFPDDNTILFLSENITILTVVPASLSSSASSITIQSTSVIAGIPFIISMVFFDLYGNKADISTRFSGIKLQNVANNLLSSSSVFLAIGGRTDISAVAYSSGNSSISILQGVNGKAFSPSEIQLHS